MRRRKFLLILSVGFLLIGTNACDNVKLSLVQGPVITATAAAVLPEICATAPAQYQANSKIMFLVDQSGSNASGTGGGTDPTKSYRLAVMQNFITKYQNNANMFIGFIAFHDTAGYAYINGGSDDNATFSNDPTQVTAALTRFVATPDEGATPYKAALEMATAAVAADRAIPSLAPSTYYIVLMSDGQPSDYGTPPVQATINGDVTTLLNAAGSGTTLSTIYYNPANVAGDAALLQSMATTGKGGFDNTNIQGKNVPLEDIIAFKTPVPWVITQFVVSNMNAAPCDDGTIDADSDADGICDKDEIRYNSLYANDATLLSRMNGKTFDPQNRNSFTPSYNDLFSYRHIVYGETDDTSCTLTGNQATDTPDNLMLNTCEKLAISSTTPSGPTNVWTTAMGTKADSLNFDSDGDGFIDWLEIIFGRSTSAVLNYNSPQQVLQGYSMSQIILQHRNPLNPVGNVAYDGVFQFEKVNSQAQNCYTYSQPTVPLYHTLPVTGSQVSGYGQLAHGTDENVFLIYYIEKPENAINGPGQIMSMYQTFRFSNVNQKLNLDPTQFVSFSAANSKVGVAISGGTTATTSSTATTGQ